MRPMLGRLTAAGMLRPSGANLSVKLIVLVISGGTSLSTWPLRQFSTEVLAVDGSPLVLYAGILHEGVRLLVM